jgi:hypothetical protein
MATLIGTKLSPANRLGVLMLCLGIGCAVLGHVFKMPELSGLSAGLIGGGLVMTERQETTPPAPPAA